MTERRRIRVRGVVQGTGFRPFVYRLARRLQLAGWVANDSGGVQIEIEGDADPLGCFLAALENEKPATVNYRDVCSETVPVCGERDFQVRDSLAAAAVEPVLPADLATCDDCLREITDPRDRRFGYPFTNCTQCGPRFSIVEALPYDRANTAMRGFVMCPACRREYGDPANRRFHAQPNACPDCGPRLALVNAAGETLAETAEALAATAALLRDGRIVALKGIGGFQLLALAGHDGAVRRLRERKRRPHKPFALLYPGIDAVRADCHIGETEAAQLLSPQAPIVILGKRRDVFPGVAPDSPELGVMLPCSPLHHLLMRQLGEAVVATSGNLSEEPICIDNEEALVRLGGIADAFLVHDRPIVRPLDDSVLRVMDGKPVLLRRARGYAPRPLDIDTGQQVVLAVGGHLKNTVALARNDRVVLSQHIGDLENTLSGQAFERAIGDLSAFYHAEPALILHDQHPGYRSTQWAQARNVPTLGVQHHVSHFFACMAEHGNREPALGVCWDGSGYDTGGIVRGGECLTWNGRDEPVHAATLREFPLPGGEQAIREPRRAALGLLFAAGDNDPAADAPLALMFSAEERRVLTTMLQRDIQSPLCTSAGRLFDAVAALLGLCAVTTYEGQAAMQLEALAREGGEVDPYPIAIRAADGPDCIDWGPLLAALLEARRAGVPAARIAAGFHQTLAAVPLALARRHGFERVFLSGGVFQNRVLLEAASQRLRAAGLQVFSHGGIPPNDGGIAVGQLYYHARVPAARPGEGN